MPDMARSMFRFAATAACAAALSLAAAPAMARDHSYGRHHRGDGISAGDVFAGVLILGGIAAIAGAASKGKRDREDDYRYRDSYPDDRPAYREQSSYSNGGIDNAVNLCVDQVERGDERVAAVDNAARTGSGWQISGQLEAGGNFSCSIDNDGRIRNVDLGDGYSYQDGSDDYRGSAADGQWNDDAYARARADTDSADPYDGSTTENY